MLALPRPQAAGQEAARSLPDAGVRTAARARRPPRVPEWLTELAQSSGGPAPWAQMSHAVLAIAAPVAVGLAAGHLTLGCPPGWVGCSLRWPTGLVPT